VQRRRDKRAAPRFFRHFRPRRYRLSAHDYRREMAQRF
jgi:hypothetical protein